MLKLFHQNEDFTKQNLSRNKCILNGSFRVNYKRRRIILVAINCLVLHYKLILNGKLIDLFNSLHNTNKAVSNK